MNTDRTTLVALLSQAEEIARKDHQGHFTLMRFTTGWKAVFGTPLLVTDERYQWLFSQPTFDTAEEAIGYALNMKPRPECPAE